MSKSWGNLKVDHVSFISHASICKFNLLFAWLHQPYVCLFVQICSSEPLVEISWFFCKKLGCHLTYKVSEFQKISFQGFWVKTAQNELKVRFFKFYEKSTHGTFLFVCMKFYRNISLKVDLNYFFGKNLVGGFWAKMGPKNGFSSFMKNLHSEFSFNL